MMSEIRAQGRVPVVRLGTTIVPAVDYEPDELEEPDLNLDPMPRSFFYPLSMHEVDEQEGDDWIDEERIADGDYYIPKFEQRNRKFENYHKEGPISRLEKMNSSDLEAMQVCYCCFITFHFPSLILLTRVFVRS